MKVSIITTLLLIFLAVPYAEAQQLVTLNRNKLKTEHTTKSKTKKSTNKQKKATARRNVLLHAIHIRTDGIKRIQDLKRPRICVLMTNTATILHTILHTPETTIYSMYILTGRTIV